MDIARDTANTVNAAIEGAGETVKSITEKTGLPYTTIYRKLNYAESAPLNIRELGTIAGVLGVSIYELLPAQDAA